MVEKQGSVRGDIMLMLKNKFGSLSFWGRIESDIALMCSELPEPTSPKKKDDLIKKLKDLKVFISSQNVPDEDLKFLDEEVELFQKVKLISLYEEKEDEIDSAVLSHCIRTGRGTEGIIAIPQDYNYIQLSKLSNGVYEKTGLVKFYISREQTLYGKIVAEIYDYAQEIPIATVVESRKKDKETDEPKFKGIKLFGQKYTKIEFQVLKEINLHFFVYRFITEHNKDLILFTTHQCEIGDYVISGVQTQCDDYKTLTDSAKLPTKLPFFFSQEIKNRIIQFKNHEQFGERLKILGINKRNLFDFPFTVSKNKETYRLLQPIWYKWLIWSWLTHEGKGLVNNYPLHLIILGPKMSGKSLLLNSLHAKSKEVRNIFSGSSSTLKHLVPSFKYNPARIGYLAESNRFSFCDEFLRCLTNTRTTKEGSQREESVAIMNDLLEHQKREAGSGVSRVNVNMTSRIIATTNPVRDIKNVDKLIDTFDESFLSRWLIYYQTEDHVQLVRRSNDADLKKYDFKLNTNDWVSILDYLQTFSAGYDLKRVGTIHKSVPQVLTENLNKHYDARHMHHIECLMDGIIKTRCLLENDMSFEATEEDYKILKEVWSNVIGSWLNVNQIKNIPIEERIFYLPEDCQYLYWKICEQKKPVSREKAEELALEALSKARYYETWAILINMGVIVESNGIATPHYFDEHKTKGESLEGVI